MKNLHNIEKSAFNKGEYVGYAGGVWRIRRNTLSYGNWIARHRDMPNLVFYAFTLSALSDKLNQYTILRETLK